MTFADLKVKYPTINHGPMSDCPRCNGEGEYHRNIGPLPCMCLFVDHDLMPLAHDCMNETIRKIREEHGL